MKGQSEQPDQRMGHPWDGKKAAYGMNKGSRTGGGGHRPAPNSRAAERVELCPRGRHLCVQRACNPHTCPGRVIGSLRRALKICTEKDGTHPRLPSTPCFSSAQVGLCALPRGCSRALLLAGGSSGSTQKPRMCWPHGAAGCSVPVAPRPGLRVLSSPHT